jgi:hypothetical protein
MEITIARLNIEHFRKKLSDEADETTRQLLLRLLAEEETKLARLTNRSLASKDVKVGVSSIASRQNR